MGAETRSSRSGTRQAKPARGPLEQADSQLMLELRDALAHRLLRDAQPPRGVAETAVTDDGSEKNHVGGGDHDRQG
jgi:hypothetical protein